MKKLTKTHLEEWLQAYGDSWSNADAEAAVALFDEDCMFYSSPFELPLEGRDAIRAYWAQIPGYQTNVRFHWQVFETRSLMALVYCQVFFTALPGGEATELNGVMELKFGTNGQCKQVREWLLSRVIPPVIY